jgi:hypothetical protein
MFSPLSLSLTGKLENSIKKKTLRIGFSALEGRVGSAAA